MEEKNYVHVDAATKSLEIESSTCDTRTIASNHIERSENEKNNNQKNMQMSFSSELLLFSVFF